MLQEKGCSSCLFQKEPWIRCGFLNFVFVLIFFFFMPAVQCTII